MSAPNTAQTSGRGSCCTSQSEVNAAPQLTRDEWKLVLELLQSERRELPPEIHHTDTPRVHDALIEREHVVDAVIKRIRQAVK